MSTVTVDLKTLTTWATLAALVVGGVVALMRFGPPVSLSRMVQAEEKVDRNERRSQNNKADISKYSGYITKLQRDQAVNDEYQKGVQRDLTDAKQERKDLNENVQKIIQLLGTTR